MERVIVGAWEDRDVADRVEAALIQGGIPKDDIDVVKQGKEKEGFWDQLKRFFGAGDDDTKVYREGLQRGDTLVVVRTNDVDEKRVVDIMERFNPINIEGRATEPSAVESRQQAVKGEGRAIPIIEEELEVGKRAVLRGGTRIFKRIVEKPVEEDVRLREEHVRVEHRRVNREATPADIQAFEEGVIEMTETREEPVVQKQARVVEEVVLDKDVEERTAKVRDTVKRTDVQVERIAGDEQRAQQQTAQLGDADIEEDSFRDYYRSHQLGSEEDYDTYRRAYRYGHGLAFDDSLRGAGDWDSLSNNAKLGWDRERPGTWQRFKDVIRYGWERARDASSGERRRKGT